MLNIKEIVEIFQQLPENEQFLFLAIGDSVAAGDNWQFLNQIPVQTGKGMEVMYVPTFAPDQTAIFANSDEDSDTKTPNLTMAFSAPLWCHMFGELITCTRCERVDFNGGLLGQYMKWIRHLMANPYPASMKECIKAGLDPILLF